MCSVQVMRVWGTIFLFSSVVQLSSADTTLGAQEQLVKKREFRDPAYIDEAPGISNDLPSLPDNRNSQDESKVAREKEYEELSETTLDIPVTPTQSSTSPPSPGSFYALQFLPPDLDVSFEPKGETIDNVKPQISEEANDFEGPLGKPDIKLESFDANISQRQSHSIDSAVKQLKPTVGLGTPDIKVQSFESNISQGQSHSLDSPVKQLKSTVGLGTPDIKVQPFESNISQGQSHSLESPVNQLKPTVGLGTPDIKVQSFESNISQGQSHSIDSPVKQLKPTVGLGTPDIKVQPFESNISQGQSHSLESPVNQLKPTVGLGTPDIKVQSFESNISQEQSQTIDPQVEELQLTFNEKKHVDREASQEILQEIDITTVLPTEPVLSPEVYDSNKLRAREEYKEFEQPLITQESLRLVPYQGETEELTTRNPVQDTARGSSEQLESPLDHAASTSHSNVQVPNQESFESTETSLEPDDTENIIEMTENPLYYQLKDSNQDNLVHINGEDQSPTVDNEESLIVSPTITYEQTVPNADLKSSHPQRIPTKTPAADDATIENPTAYQLVNAGDEFVPVAKEHHSSFSSSSSSSSDDHEQHSLLATSSPNDLEQERLYGESSSQDIEITGAPKPDEQVYAAESPSENQISNVQIPNDLPAEASETLLAPLGRSTHSGTVPLFSPPEKREKVPALQPTPIEESQVPGMPYSFSYKVRDPSKGADYGHAEDSDGNIVKGQYYVLLPDGRRQTVQYQADHVNGYQSEVEYQPEEGNFPGNDMAELEQIFNGNNGGNQYEPPSSGNSNNNQFPSGDVQYQPLINDIQIQPQDIRNEYNSPNFNQAQQNGGDQYQSEIPQTPVDEQYQTFNNDIQPHHVQNEVQFQPQPFTGGQFQSAPAGDQYPPPNGGQFQPATGDQYQPPSNGQFQPTSGGEQYQSYNGDQFQHTPGGDLPPTGGQFQPAPSSGQYQIPNGGQFQGAPGGDQYQPPSGGQFQSAPGGAQYQPPNGGQFQPSPASDQYQPPSGGQFQPAPASDQYHPPTGGQFQPAPGGDQHQPPNGDQFQAVPGGDQYQSSNGGQFQPSSELNQYQPTNGNNDFGPVRYKNRFQMVRGDAQSPPFINNYNPQPQAEDAPFTPLHDESLFQPQNSNGQYQPPSDNGQFTPQSESNQYPPTENNQFQEQTPFSNANQYPNIPDQFKPQNENTQSYSQTDSDQFQPHAGTNQFLPSGNSGQFQPHDVDFQSQSFRDGYQNQEQPQNQPFNGHVSNQYESYDEEELGSFDDDLQYDQPPIGNNQYSPPASNNQPQYASDGAPVPEPEPGFGPSFGPNDQGNYNSGNNVAGDNGGGNFKVFQIDENFNENRGDSFQVISNYQGSNEDSSDQENYSGSQAYQERQQPRDPTKYKEGRTGLPEPSAVKGSKQLQLSQPHNLKSEAEHEDCGHFKPVSDSST